ncbi:hypothetical protein BCV70DRAFT_200524 [Testicularia cyperi]|uniref:C3H1-type domain-containing protein n=1 Tax=Testicularia cyperi TaxID=1882483 RepID=A0A317XNC9_9BASI|nr:hypothetical protein BCV70DRAFT_200524 [Testicularia cyperi]
MSAAVRAALAVKRAEQRSRSRSASPTKQLASDSDVSNAAAEHGNAANSTGSKLSFGRDLDPSIASPFGSPKPKSKPIIPSSVTYGEVDLGQKSLDDIVRSSVRSGKANCSSRSPSLQEVPPLLLTLLSDDPPSWYLAIPDDDREPWYTREELHTLQLGNNDILQLSDKLSEFRGLKRLELHSNQISSLPTPFFQLTALTTLTLSKNSLTSFPTCLLALDNLVSLDLSNNKITTLWTDADVVQARSERSTWETQNADEVNGVWAGLSPSKRDRKALLPDGTPEMPMSALRTLDLSNNRLANAALGIPDLANRRNKTTDLSALRPLCLPNGLKKLDLSHNSIRGPVSTSLFARLDSLEDLGLQGCGLGDDVFAVDSASSSADRTLLPALSTLDLSGCELDDLTHIEASFGSRRIKALDQALGFREDNSDSTEPLPELASALSRRQLVRTVQRPSASDIQKMEQIVGGRILCLLLEGNPLREEAFRQKRGGRMSPEKKAASTTSRDMSALPRNIPEKPRVASSSPVAASSASAALAASDSASRSPSKPTIVKEDWELLAEAGLNTELGRRKLRIEQARKEREAAAAAAAAAAKPDDAQSKGDGSVAEEAQTRGRTRDASALNAAGAEASESEPNPNETSSSKERSTSQTGEEAIDDKDAGSALANAKLSTKKKEALGQVPCKFFRSNGCSAGASCPFAHTLPGDGGQKSVCQWFLKGNCRFGHKCALAHILPGQPMSMDRKNKRAAQHGQPLPQMPAGAPAQTQAQGQAAPIQSQNQGQSQGQTQAQGQTSANSIAPNQMNSSPNVAAGASGGAHGQLQPGQLKPGSSSQRQPSSLSASLQQQFHQQSHQSAQQQPSHQNPQSQNHTGSAAGPKFRNRVTSTSGRGDQDFAFGLPDDMQALSPPSTGGMHPGFEGLGTSMRNTPTAPFAGSTSYSRPASLSQSHSASLAAPGLMNGLDSPAAAAAFGTSASSRVFGTSPFSHPGGHGLFFSQSQDDSEGGAGPFARGGRDVSGARSISRADDPATAQWWNSLGSGSRATSGVGSRQVQGNSSREEEIEDAEDFLPSSLSDLLTPAELERRRRNNGSRLSSSFVGNDDRIVVAQSMPAQANIGVGFLRSSRAPIGAERSPSHDLTSSNLSAGFFQQQQQQQHQQGKGSVGSLGGEAYRPFGDTRVSSSSGLDSIAFRESSPALSGSLGRTSIQHAPGQSLPQGLAAGLSRLHLRSGSGTGVSSNKADGPGNVAGPVGGIGSQLSAAPGSGSGAGGRLGGLSSGAMMGGGGGGGGGVGTMAGSPAHASGGAGSMAFSQTSQSGGGIHGALRPPGSLDDYGLGPTAPSSLLTHRSPMMFAVGGQMGGGGGASGFSPQMSAIGSQRPGEGIAIPDSSLGGSLGGIGGSSSSSSGGGFGAQPVSTRYGGASHRQHPGMQRLRAGSSAAAPHSPLSLPVVTAEEDEEEAIFELE